MNSKHRFQRACRIPGDSVLFAKTAILALALTFVLTCEGVAWAQKKGGGGSPPPGPSFRYTLSILQPLGTRGCDVYGMNNHGDVVGRAATDIPDRDGNTRYHGVMWFFGGSTATDLNSMIDASAGWIITEARDVNDNLQIACTGVYLSDDLSVQRQCSLRLDFDLEQGRFNVVELPNVDPAAINNDGDIVGIEWSDRIRPVLYTADGQRILMGDLKGYNTFASGLTNRANGRLIVAGSADGWERLGWKADVNLTTLEIQPLQSLGFAYSDSRNPGWSKAWGINNQGDIVGETPFTKGESFAGRYRSGSWTNLGSLNTNLKSRTWNDSVAWGINDPGYAVGQSRVGTSSSIPNVQPFLYHDTFKMVNLDGLIDALPTSLLGALVPQKIDNANRISGNVTGQGSGFILVPYSTP
jgi:hypothetical protein